MRGRKGAKLPSWAIQPWESALVKEAARRIRTTERDQLESELSLHVVLLKRRQLRGIRNWAAFLRKALHNKARNWIRDHQARQQKMVSLDEPPKAGLRDASAWHDIVQAAVPDPDLRIAFRRAWGELGPELRTLWRLLLENKGNQVEVARLMGKHRNTVRLWIRRIQTVLRRHGF